MTTWLVELDDQELVSDFSHGNPNISVTRPHAPSC